VAEIGKRLIFWLILDPHFFSFRPSNPPLFIDSDGKDPNHWLKVGMVYCQIVKSAAVGCLSWPLWGGSTSVYLTVSWWRPYPDVEGCLMISFMQVLANLVDVRYIKCSCKVGNWTSYFKELKKRMNSTRIIFWPKFISVLPLLIAFNWTPNWP